MTSFTCLWAAAGALQGNSITRWSPWKHERGSICSILAVPTPFSDSARHSRHRRCLTLLDAHGAVHPLPQGQVRPPETFQVSSIINHGGATRGEGWGVRSQERQDRQQGSSLTSPVPKVGQGQPRERISRQVDGVKLV